MKNMPGVTLLMLLVKIHMMVAEWELLSGMPFPEFDRESLEAIKRKAREEIPLEEANE